jgi:hypothetical protein
MRENFFQLFIKGLMFKNSKTGFVWGLEPEGEGRSKKRV